MPYGQYNIVNHRTLCSVFNVPQLVMVLVGLGEVSLGEVGLGKVGYMQYRLTSSISQSYF